LLLGLARAVVPVPQNSRHLKTSESRRQKSWACTAITVLVNYVFNIHTSMYMISKIYIIALNIDSIDPTQDG
jgi:hypothetical protein